MAKVTLTGHIVVPAADLVAVAAELTNHIALTRAEQGCLMFEVSKDSSDPHRFNVYEEFRNQESFLLHQKRVADSDWGRITKGVARFYDIQGLD